MSFSEVIAKSHREIDWLNFGAQIKPYSLAQRVQASALSSKRIFKAQIVERVGFLYIKVP